MSIIADTLQRLQTQTNGERSDPPDSPSIVMPARGKREPGWHTPPSRLKFWLAGICMAIGLSGLGLFAYWIGFNLEFGMATYASPKTSESIALSVPPPIQGPPPFASPSSESLQIPSAEPVQDLPLSASLQPEGDLSTIQDGVSPETPNPRKAEGPLSTPHGVETPVSSVPEARTIASTLRQTHQRSISQNVSIPNNSTEISPKRESSESKTASTGLPAASSAQSDKPGLKPDESEDFNGTEENIPVEVALEEERMRVEVTSGAAHQPIAETSLLPNMTAMIPKKEKPPQTPVPVQLSPTNRLQHAQQLIQSGKYDEAHSFLSPLFKDPPVDWEPWFWMGTALLGQDHLEQADQFFLSGLARNDKIPQLWVQRALVAHQRGEYQLAIHELRRAESLDATLPHTHLNMGYAYEKLGNDRLANEYYAKFLKLSEGNPAFFSIRKKLYARFTEQVHSTLNPGLPSFLPENP